MSEITESEIFHMSKEENYLKGYSDGKEDALDKIRAEIADLDDAEYNHEGYFKAITDVLEIIDKYREESKK